ncbi:hypothetical protein DV096_16790 [Bradymonadaceae bacterium TMQ3]|uniref:DUF4230 domain-containing protein n=1 Tax=Lujinxingia sediminis TaxID=2480984 RepID=A0ABY0CNM1_9DELT|nr:hypothetical protein [Lujinxingia sediminis]RDV36746.1 hypothetical protein DV096_16790 [Bradymonadaceae bacterium TMQ3]RVU41553.1 hypothetical protein EA187_18000 [Lujinxingia sediminis]TXC69368.1 hypothetical protein FRC91_17370 [Bradymonadales bacterium TMQ1]
MHDPMDTIANVISWIFGIALFGTIFMMLWSVWKYDDPLRDIRIARGWKLVEIEEGDATWMIVIRQGVMRFRIGMVRVKNESDPRRHWYRWGVEMEFDAPFPGDLVVEPHGADVGKRVDFRLMETTDAFVEAFSAGGGALESAPVKARFAELLEAFERDGYLLTLDRHRIRVVTEEELVTDELLEAHIDRCLEAGEEIAALAGFTAARGEEPGHARTDVVAGDTWEREEANSSVEW